MTEQKGLPAGLVEKLSDSIRSGRHQPLLEVEPAPCQRGRYQIICGEQRWRAAKAAGLLEIPVSIHPHLGYLERLTKQYEEDRLRADLDVVEEAHCITVTWNKAAASHSARGSNVGPLPVERAA
ncbi:MAG: ParB N-terminal domain-containing protein [Candidatus Dormibacteraceae bacterium]